MKKDIYTIFMVIPYFLVAFFSAIGLFIYDTVNKIRKFFKKEVK
jgi:hypothetical protein